MELDARVTVMQGTERAGAEKVAGGSEVRERDKGQ